MRKDLLHILQHSLGLDQYGRGRQYRNHYVAGGDDVGRCQELAAMGYMREHKMSPALTGGSPCFVVTDRGFEAVALYSPAPPPEPKLTAAQKRYQEHLDADGCWSFAESLGITVPRLESENRWIDREYKDGLMVAGHYQRCYRYTRLRRYYWGDEITAGDWKPTKKEAKASYKEALRQRREREKQATQAVA